MKITGVHSTATRSLRKAVPSSEGARERIDRVAYELFSRRGIRGVGIDAVIAESGVAKMTLYRHYPSKEKLALAFLQRREELWTRAWLQDEVERRARAPGDRLLAIFDVFDKWFRHADFEGCSFINVLLETDNRASPVRIATVHHLEVIRNFLRQLARDGDVIDADGFARQWHILMKGSIVAAAEGDKDAARRAKELGVLLLVKEKVAHGSSVKLTAKLATRKKAPIRAAGKQ